MRYECGRSKICPDEWFVEAVDVDSVGEIYVTLFSGPSARERAEQYAAWKNKELDNA